MAAGLLALALLAGAVIEASGLHSLEENQRGEFDVTRSDRGQWAERVRLI